MIADELVREYKDHGFVIDSDEARVHLGNDWIKTGTVEIEAAERLYNLFEEVNVYLTVYPKKYIVVSGEFAARDVFVFERRTEPAS